MFLKTAFTVSALAFAGSASAAEVVSNGGFELGMGADADAWEEFGGAFRDNSSPLAGDWSMQMNAVGGDGIGAASGATYNSIANGGFASLQESTMVTLSFDATTNFGPGGVGFYVLRILNGSGAIVADSGLQNMAASGTNSYSVSAMVPAFGMAPDDTYAAFVSIEAVAGGFIGSSASATVDNVSIQAELVPAPSAMALLGLGGLAATRRRR
jgi:hypothetical protein